VSYYYTDASRETDPGALPDIEVFHPREYPATLGVGMETYPYSEGYYYAYGQPGCLWDSESSGPYATEAAALKAAREDAGYCEHGIAEDAICESCPAPVLWTIREGVTDRFLHFSWGSLNGGSCAAYASEDSARAQLVRLQDAGIVHDARVERLSDTDARRWGQPESQS
jgi:hypothetical protein